jgi:hypothetical protein
MIPPGLPTSTSAARTVLFASANGGNFGKIRPKSTRLAGRPSPIGYRPGPIAAGMLAAAVALDAGAPAPVPTEPATNPAPVAPNPFKKSRRDGSRPRVSLLICLPFSSVGYVGYLPTVTATGVLAGLAAPGWIDCRMPPAQSPARKPTR